MKSKKIRPHKDHTERIGKLISWADKYCQKYEEPTRLGTKKGNSIGLSKQKIKAAIFTALYPDYLSLKKIAKIADVPYGTLRMWRIEKEFTEKVEELREKALNLIDYSCYYKKRGYHIFRHKKWNIYKCEDCGYEVKLNEDPIEDNKEERGKLIGLILR